MKPKKPVEVIVFEDPEKKKKKDSSADEKPGNARSKFGKKSSYGPSTSGVTNRQPVYDQKKAKHEIRKLGIYGMDKKNKEVAMVDLLVELGAKPPRRRCYHIQEYQRMMKEKKKEEEEKEELERQSGIKKKKRRDKRQRDKDDILDFVDGQTGYYKAGVQFVKGIKK